MSSRRPQPLRVLFHTEAIADYSSDNPRDLSFKAGQTIRIVKDDDSGWWVGVSDSGASGNVPSTFLKKVNRPSSSQATSQPQPPPPYTPGPGSYGQQPQYGQGGYGRGYSAPNYSQPGQQQPQGYGRGGGGYTRGPGSYGYGSGSGYGSGYGSGSGGGTRPAGYGYVGISSKSSPSKKTPIVENSARPGFFENSFHFFYFHSFHSYIFFFFSISIAFFQFLFHLPTSILSHTPPSPFSFLLSTNIKWRNPRRGPRRSPRRSTKKTRPFLENIPPWNRRNTKKASPQSGSELKRLHPFPPGRTHSSFAKELPTYSSKEADACCAQPEAACTSE